MRRYPRSWRLTGEIGKNYEVTTPTTSIRELARTLRLGVGPRKKDEWWKCKRSERFGGGANQPSVGGGKVGLGSGKSVPVVKENWVIKVEGTITW